MLSNPVLYSTPSSVLLCVYKCDEIYRVYSIAQVSGSCFWGGGERYPYIQLVTSVGTA